MIKQVWIGCPMVAQDQSDVTMATVGKAPETQKANSNTGGLLGEKMRE